MTRRARSVHPVTLSCLVLRGLCVHAAVLCVNWRGPRMLNPIDRIMVGPAAGLARRVLRAVTRGTLARHVSRTLERATSSPLRLLLATLAVFSLTAILVMWFLMPNLLPHPHGFSAGVIDATIMSFASAPFIWWLIARQHRAEEFVVRQERRFQALIENTLDLIWTIRPDGNIAYVSPSVERTLGYKPEEFIGKAASDLVHPDDLPKVM